MTPAPVSRGRYLDRLGARIRSTGTVLCLGIDIEPGEICIIPRGVIFAVDALNGPARAFVCENYGG